MTAFILSNVAAWTESAADCAASGRSPLAARTSMHPHQKTLSRLLTESPRGSGRSGRGGCRVRRLVPKGPAFNAHAPAGDAVIKDWDSRIKSQRNGTISHAGRGRVAWMGFILKNRDDEHFLRMPAVQAYHPAGGGGTAASPAPFDSGAESDRSPAGSRRRVGGVSVVANLGANVDGAVRPVSLGRPSTIPLVVSPLREANRAGGRRRMTMPYAQTTSTPTMTMTRERA
jgi:hypothetical protein